MDRQEIIAALGKIGGFFAARADMAIGDGKMLLLHWNAAANEAAILLKAQEPACAIDYNGVYLCPECRYAIHRGVNFCPKCGQAVKWDGGRQNEIDN